MFSSIKNPTSLAPAAKASMVSGSRDVIAAKSMTGIILGFPSIHTLDGPAWVAMMRPNAKT